MFPISDQPRPGRGIAIIARTSPPVATTLREAPHEAALAPPPGHRKSGVLRIATMPLGNLRGEGHPLTPPLWGWYALPYPIPPGGGSWRKGRFVFREAFLFGLRVRLSRWVGVLAASVDHRAGEAAPQLNAGGHRV